jgi:hypothetical protein
MLGLNLRFSCLILFGAGLIGVCHHTSCFPALCSYAEDRENSRESKAPNSPAHQGSILRRGGLPPWAPLKGGDTLDPQQPTLFLYEWPCLAPSLDGYLLSAVCQALCLASGTELGPTQTQSLPSEFRAGTVSRVKGHINVKHTVVKCNKGGERAPWDRFMEMGILRECQRVMMALEAVRTS